MDRSNAEQLMAALTRLGDALNGVDHEISMLPAGEEKEKLRHGLASMMAALWIDLMRPIVHKHPDLDPDKDTDWFRDLQARRQARGDKEQGGDS